VTAEYAIATLRGRLAALGASTMDGFVTDGAELRDAIRMGMFALEAAWHLSLSDRSDAPEVIGARRLISDLEMSPPPPSP